MLTAMWGNSKQSPSSSQAQGLGELEESVADEPVCQGGFTGRQEQSGRDDLKGQPAQRRVFPQREQWGKGQRGKWRHG